MGLLSFQRILCHSIYFGVFLYIQEWGEIKSIGKLSRANSEI